ncbi:MAG: bifunctional phosphopantothenoylcysteine decarboxylase/phosphopantothenate--cysteine ligase CoaBC [Anaerovibrio sp.]|nr:bifunctional phosphopantothenoylcysteine decarboxylase/phosphopantothenate--cysteine ligase CoaBC [Anaerovibrio sp.]
MLQDKNIIIGVTGGIAAYKTVELVSRLRKSGANVHVIMTQGAQNFVTELTFREISGHPVVTSMWDRVQEFKVEHIALAQLADMVVIAPATANILAKMAIGMADDMLTTTVLATKAPVLVVPAMNSNMYTNPATQQNIGILKDRGMLVLEPASGHLACGTAGIGRMPEAAEIFDYIANYFAEGREQQDREELLAKLKGKKVLVTAAGTREPIDPVRYIGNRSSGKMGYAIAEAAVKCGAKVVLISGPSSLQPPAGAEFIPVESAREMRQHVLEHFPNTDVVIKAAAVADYRVRDVAENKIKKDDEELVLVLDKNPDILKEMGQLKKPGQILVGFAAETQNLLQYAKGKLEKKNLDMIVANDVTKPQAGFNTDTNLIKLLGRDGSVEELPLMSKKELAYIIWQRVMKLL